MMEGGVWEVRLCCPRVQGGRGGPLHLYGVSLVVSAMGDEDVGGRQLIHLCAVGEVAVDSDLGGVVIAGGGVGDDVVGRPFVVGGVLHRVQLEWGVEWFGRWKLFLGFRLGRHFGFNQVLRAPGFRGSYLDGCRCCGLEEGEAGSDPRGHLGVTWGVYLCAGKPPLADIILSHPPDLTRCDSVIGLAIPAMSGYIQNRGTASGDLYIGISGINRVLLS